MSLIVAILFLLVVIWLTNVDLIPEFKASFWLALSLSCFPLINPVKLVLTLFMLVFNSSLVEFIVSVNSVGVTTLFTSALVNISFSNVVWLTLASIFSCKALFILFVAVSVTTAPTLLLYESVTFI